MLVVVTAGTVLSALLSWRYNALLSGGDAACSMGVNVPLLRFVSLLTASLMTAVCVSFLGVIGFVGIICPHSVKRLLGQDHRLVYPRLPPSAAACFCCCRTPCPAVLAAAQPSRWGQSASCWALRSS